MKIIFSPAKMASQGISVIPVVQGKTPMGSSRLYVEAGKQQYASAAKAAFFKGKKGQKFDIYAPAGASASRLHICGIGKKNNFDSELFAANITEALLMTGQTTLTLHLDGLGLSPDQTARAAVGVRLAAYRFNYYRTKLADDKKPCLKTLRIVADEPKSARQVYTDFHGPICDGQLYARDLVNEPPNKLYPKTYAARIKKLEVFGLKVEVLGEKRMKTLGMNSLLCVGVGSARESQLVVMHWTGGAKGKAPAVLVGKGVTFDAGGISLKPGNGMWDMKGDMGGSAAVVGAMIGLAKRKAKANVIGIVGLVENMPDGKAVLPGDIVTSMSGQTIEVLNTDAEGRLVLADALHYAVTKYKPKAMIDLATLTGAVISALGREHAGVFSNNDELATQIASASKGSTEKTWRLPLAPEYDKQLDSANADMKNIGTDAGAIVAAQFLKRFVGDTTWAHIDIAGTGMKNKRHDPRETTFGTGYGARLLNHWVAENFE